MKCVYRCASVGGSGACPLDAGVAEMVTGVPASDVLLPLADAGFDEQRVETAGLFQRLQAGIADAVEERAVGIEQPVEPVDQHADREQIEQRLVARGLAARRRLGRRQPVRLVVGRSRLRPARVRAASSCALRGASDAGGSGAGSRSARVFGLEPRRQLARELVEGVVFDRRQRRRFRLVDRPERQRRFWAFPRMYPVLVCANRFGVKFGVQSVLAIQERWRIGSDSPTAIPASAAMSARQRRGDGDGGSLKNS